MTIRAWAGLARWLSGRQPNDMHSTDVPSSETQSTATADAPGQSTRFNLTPNLLAALPPEMRDRLLEYLRAWAPPQEQLGVAHSLRDAHGPLLFLLDYLARAHLLLGEAVVALELIERRQRRSSTVASQALEGRALLAAGHPDHALAIADDLSQANPRHAIAITTAAEIYTSQGRFEQAQTLLDTYLALRPQDRSVGVTYARLARQAGEHQRVAELIQRLGAGVPQELDAVELRDLETLYAELGNEQSALAVHLELERRRILETEQMTALSGALRRPRPCALARPGGTLPQAQWAGGHRSQPR